MPGRKVAGPPQGFVIQRDAPLGPQRLTKVFSSLADLPPFAQLPGRRSDNLRLLGNARVHLLDETVWMYVAPRSAPPWAKDVGWKPVLSRGDCIVVGRRHLRK
ncbi:MAG: hypothetical protein L3J91_06205, partial [Thermoplasmata archaeon]|nr:hypothetical protein [Thermoplasmata archaeon]